MRLSDQTHAVTILPYLFCACLFHPRPKRGRGSQRLLLEVDQRLIYELASCRYIESSENIIFYGPPGIGKTRLAIALALKAIQKAKKVKFFKLPALLEDIKEVVDKGGNTHDFLVKLQRFHLLIL